MIASRVPRFGPISRPSKWELASGLCIGSKPKRPRAKAIEVDLRCNDQPAIRIERLVLNRCPEIVLSHLTDDDVLLEVVVVVPVPQVNAREDVREGNLIITVYRLPCNVIRHLLCNALARLCG
jgi:hypothetical protein